MRTASLTVRDSTDPDGSLRGLTKTRVDRSIDLWPALAADLEEWRELTPFAGDDDPIVPNGRREHWNDEEYKRWGRRTFRRIATAAGWATASPNKLRHLHASLLIKEGRLDSREIAERMGHSVEMLERRYAHEIREYRGRRIDVAAEIHRARELAVADADERYHRSALAAVADTEGSLQRIENQAATTPVLRRLATAGFAADPRG